MRATNITSFQQSEMMRLTETNIQTNGNSLSIKQSDVYQKSSFHESNTRDSIRWASEHTKELQIEDIDDKFVFKDGQEAELEQMRTTNN